MFLPAAEKGVYLQSQTTLPRVHNAEIKYQEKTKKNIASLDQATARGSCN